MAFKSPKLHICIGQRNPNFLGDAPNRTPLTTLHLNAGVCGVVGWGYT